MFDKMQINQIISKSIYLLLEENGNVVTKNVHLIMFFNSYVEVPSILKFIHTSKTSC